MRVCLGPYVWMVYFIFVCSMSTPISILWMKLCVCVCVLMLFCACFKEKHIFPHCQHHSSGLLLFKRRGQRSLPFFSVSWPGSVLSCSALNWTLTGCQQARGCMLPASAFQEARVFVQWVSKSLEMSSTILQNLNSSIKKGVLVWWWATARYCTILNLLRWSWL